MTLPDITGSSDRQYRRGAILGLTMAESFLLLAFALLLLLAAWHASVSQKIKTLETGIHLEPERQTILSEVANDPDMWTVMEVIHGLPQTVRTDLAQDLRATSDTVSRLTRSAEERWRFVSPELAEQVIAGLANLPEDQQSRLADLVALTEPAELVQMLDVAQARIDGVLQSLDAVSVSDADLITVLRGELGGTVQAMGGVITDSGALVLPESVLFDLGSATVRPAMIDTLSTLCPTWLDVLQASKANLLGAQIEGHASSDWGQSTGREAFLRNLTLSQSRAAAVLETCLTFLPEGGPLDRWATDHLSAVGYSSARPVLRNGIEDPIQSRRVVFSIAFDRSAALEELRASLEDAGDQPLHDDLPRGMDKSAGP